MNEISAPGQQWYDHEQVKQAYGQIGDDYHTYTLKGLNSDWWDDFIVQTQHGGLILDIGCGSGVAAQHFLHHGRHVLGIDISPKMIALARQKFPSIPFMCGNVTACRFPENCFDGIALFFTILHLPKSEAMTLLKNCHLWLEDGCSLGLSVVEGTDEGRCDNFMGQACSVYLSYYQTDELCQELHEAGFKAFKTDSKVIEGDGFKETQLFFLATK